MKPRIRIKYCGGCNPDYDRVAVADDLRVRLEGRVAWALSESEPYDRVVAVHGCQTACADLGGLSGCETHHIRCPEDLDRLVERITDEVCAGERNRFASD